MWTKHDFPLGRDCALLLALLVAAGSISPANAAPCFPAYRWVVEVGSATAGASPLIKGSVVREGFAGAIRWGVDPRLQLAIAGQESFFGLRGTCTTLNNAWGIMDSRGNCRNFSSWERGVWGALSILSRCYIYGRTKGDCSSFDVIRATIPAIGEKWCASGCGDWVLNVTAFYSTGVRQDGRTVRTSLGGDPRDLTYRGTCCGDCNGNGQVDIEDLIVLVGINLAYLHPAFCPLADLDVPADGIFVNDTISASNEALFGCIR
ncbi:MAG: hypothetical protein KatS3mg077_1550 [Candidatus Binatia bacterium]|nr:MAG: hypothetical protein KatS3mg077_1540 [Candidatus Binatia bacterium]GIW44268.1 MAG: hypothetical protein KatS3mg077_1550 [Candidatus Binatia bacterium]